MPPANAKRLLLWRHAQATAADPSQTDSERPLTPTGKQAAAAVAESFLTERPDLVLCSPALRARETLSQAEALWQEPPTLRIEPGLYLAEPLALLERISRIEEETRSVLVVGHQPGLGDFVRLLVRNGEPPALAAFARGVQPAALAELRLDLAFWREAGAECAFLSTFAVPPT